MDVDEKNKIKTKLADEIRETKKKSASTLS